MARVACSNCKHFAAFPEPERGVDGECRAHPPVVVRVLEVESLWPLVRAADWCGEFEYLDPVTERQRRPSPVAERHREAHPDECGEPYMLDGAGMLCLLPADHDGPHAPREAS